jgi:hypothetical protein
VLSRHEGFSGAKQRNIGNTYSSVPAHMTPRHQEPWPTVLRRAHTQLTNAINASGASPIIRVPNAEEYMIKRALDAGAHGIMTPMCHTAVSCPTNPMYLCVRATDEAGRRAEDRIVEQVPAQGDAGLRAHVLGPLFQPDRAAVPRWSGRQPSGDRSD